MLHYHGFTLTKSSKLAPNPRRRSPQDAADQAEWSKASNSTTLFLIKFAPLAITLQSDYCGDWNSQQCIYWRSCQRDRYRMDSNYSWYGGVYLWGTVIHLNINE